MRHLQHVTTSTPCVLLFSLLLAGPVFSGCGDESETPPAAVQDPAPTEGRSDEPGDEHSDEHTHEGEEHAHEGEEHAHAGHAPAGAVPGSHEDWCGGHDVPESLCTRCNASLIPGFQATGDWCEEHGLPESQCLTCNPELSIVRPPPTAEAQQ